MTKKNIFQKVSFWSTSNNQLEGTIGRVADTAHTGSFITRRSHLNLLWIYIVLSTPMIYKLCRFISRSNMENLKPTPRVALRLGGYNDMTQQISVVFSEVKNPRTLEGKITRSRIHIMPSEDFRIRKYMTVTKSRLNEEVSSHQKGFRFKIRFKVKMSPTKR